MRSRRLKTFSTNDLSFFVCEDGRVSRRRIIIAVDVVIVGEGVYGVDTRLSRQLMDDFIASLLEISVIGEDG